jgi:hypothetical protein
MVLSLGCRPFVDQDKWRAHHRYMWVQASQQTLWMQGLVTVESGQFVCFFTYRLTFSLFLWIAFIRYARFGSQQIDACPLSTLYCAPALCSLKLFQLSSLYSDLKWGFKVFLVPWYIFMQLGASAPLLRLVFMVYLRALPVFETAASRI